jgi:CRP-like cAMP-binding protein
MYGQLSLLFGAARTLTVVSDGNLELIVLPATDFYSMKLDGVFKAQLARHMGVIKATGAFAGFSDEELLKLASTATMRSYAKGTTLVQQGDVPSALYVLTRGVVRAVKDTNILGDLDRQLAEAGTQLEALHAGGTYHASMRHGAKLAFPGHGEVAGQQSTTGFEASPTEVAAAAGRPVSDLTAHESAAELRSTLQPSAVQVQAAQLTAHMDALRQRRVDVLQSVRQHTATLKDGLRAPQKGGKQPSGSARSAGVVSSGSAHGRLHEGEDRTNSTNILKRRVLLERALPPFMFGELAILSPWKSLEPGSIIADTYVEVLVVDKGSLPHHYMSRARLDVVRSKSIQWPREDMVLLQRYLEQSQWSQYKAQLLSN